MPSQTKISAMLSWCAPAFQKDALCGNIANTEINVKDGIFTKTDSGANDEGYILSTRVACKAMNGPSLCDRRKSDFELPETNTAMMAGMKIVEMEGESFRVPEAYRPVGFLGRGAYGTVAEFCDGSGKGVAVKKISGVFDDEDDVAQAKLVLREITLLRHFEHINVCQLVALLPPPSPSFKDIYVVMGLMETDLHNIIQSDQDLSDDVVRCFAYQILVGLKYIHSAKVVHRDMKPRNLLVNGDCDLKICDFGWSRVLGDHTSTLQDREPLGKLDRRSSPFKFGRTLTTNVVTLWYRAPELVLSESYAFGVDLFSTGCILAEILSRRALFKSRSLQEHLTMMISVLGVPSEDELKTFAMSANSSHSFSDALDRVATNSSLANAWDAVGKKTEWSIVFPDVDQTKWRPDLTTLLDKLLVFHPFARATATEALELAYFAEWHDPEEEPVCDRSIDWSFDSREMTMIDVRDAIQKACTPQDVTDGVISVTSCRSLPSIERTQSMKKVTKRLSDMPLASAAFLTGQ